MAENDHVKRMDVAEFRRLGYLQELNRRFLHPLGLALEVKVDGGTERFGGVWDYRSDPEGIRYENVDMQRRAAAIDREWETRRPVRERALGYMVQPPGGRDG